MVNRGAVAFLFAALACGQTSLDLRTQSKNVDFSSQPSTIPITVGTTTPTSCQTGQLFFSPTTRTNWTLSGCTAVNTWTAFSPPAVPLPPTSSQLGDFAASLASGTLTIGAGCSAATPCNVRIGNTPYSFTAPALITISGTTSGLVFLYIDGSGVLTAGGTPKLNCGGCTYVPAVTSFPANSIPLYIWPTNNGGFGTLGMADFRSVLSTKNLIGGTGVLISENAGASTLSVDPALISINAPPPASSISTCLEGQTAYDGTYYYICVSANTWERTAMQAW